MLTDDITSPADGTLVKTETVDVSESEDNKAWPARFTSRLSQYLSSEAIEKLKEMFLAGPVPLPAPVDDPIARPPPTPIPIPTSHPARPVPDGREAGGRGGRGDRESKGGWGGAAGRERPKAKHQDHRKVVSDVSKNFNIIIFSGAELRVNTRPLEINRSPCRIKVTELSYIRPSASFSRDD